MSTTASKHAELTEAIVNAGDERNANHEAISELIKLAGILTAHPGAPVVQDIYVRFEQPFPGLDDVASVRGPFEGIAAAFRRAHAALTIGVEDPHAFDFTWRLGDGLRVDWTVARKLLGPEPFLCTTCNGAQRVGTRGHSEHCPDCDHGWYERASLTPVDVTEVIS
jgi:hypothetical protein